MGDIIRDYRSSTQRFKEPSSDQKGRQEISLWPSQHESYIGDNTNGQIITLDHDIAGFTGDPQVYIDNEDGTYEQLENVGSDPFTSDKQFQWDPLTNEIIFGDGTPAGGYKPVLDVKILIIYVPKLISIRTKTWLWTGGAGGSAIGNNISPDDDIILDLLGIDAYCYQLDLSDVSAGPTFDIKVKQSKDDILYNSDDLSSIIYLNKDPSMIYPPREWTDTIRFNKFLMDINTAPLTEGEEVKFYCQLRKIWRGA